MYARLKHRINGTLAMAKQWNSAMTSARKDHFAAVFDFHYHHYALGDTLTSLVEIACQAHEVGSTGVDIYVAVFPASPAARTQGFITPENYVHHLDNLFPAFLAAPMLNSVHLLRDGGLSTSFHIWRLHRSKVPMWPPMGDQMSRHVFYPLRHNHINRFHKEQGWLPLLQAPRGLQPWAERWLTGNLADKMVVCLNPRQSRLTPSPATIYRDAHLPDWYAFVREAALSFPDVRFVMLGGYNEWEPDLALYPNVVIPRALGLTLAHELSILVNADLFMGTSSGFATMATFSTTPYLITDIEHHFAQYAEVAVGAENYPFALPQQKLMWRRETSADLVASLAENYQIWKTNGSNRYRAKPAQHPYRAVA